MAILGKNIVAKVFQNCQNGDKSTHLVKLLSVCISCLSSLSVFCLSMNFAQIVTFKILFHVFDKSLVDFLNNLFQNKFSFCPGWAIIEPVLFIFDCVIMFDEFLVVISNYHSFNIFFFSRWGYDWAPSLSYMIVSTCLIRFWL